MSDKKNVEYTEYIFQFSLVLLAVSSAYLFDISKIYTAGVFILIPALFGYTAFISSEEFRYSSLLSLFGLVFLTVDKVAPVAIIVGIGNPLISLLSNGDSFKDFYKSVSIPMLLTGLILGTAIFGAAYQSPEIRNSVQNTTTSLVSTQTSNVLEETELIERQREANKRMTRGISRSSITMTQSYVFNGTELNASQEQQLLSGLSKARREVPERLVNQTGKNNATASDISQRASQTVESAITKENLFLLVPVIGLGFYSLHPIIGLLTALFGSFYSYTTRKFEHEEKSESLNQEF